MASKPAATKTPSKVHPTVNVIEPQPTEQIGTATKTVYISGKLPSGLRKAAYEVALQNINFNLVDDVSVGLTFLVLADPASTSSKAEKARKLGVQVISEGSAHRSGLGQVERTASNC